MSPVKLHAFVVPGFILMASASPCAEDPKDAPVTDPAKAGADYAVAGEYEGDHTAGGQKKKLGVQVRALGGGKFSAAALEGGLPGAGWDGKSRTKADGETREGVTTFPGLLGAARVKDGVLSIEDPAGKTVAELKKVERRSPTLGMKPPEGAIVLFDGKSADEFREPGKLGKDGLLIQGSTTKREFQDATLHIEFQTSFMPRASGQNRSNSGCYFQGRYEVQILDSFGLEGAHDECGGIYKVARPKVHMCYPPLSWQTYDVELTAPRFDAAGKKSRDAMLTVRHNGVLIHEAVKVPGPTTAAPFKEGPGPGPLHLQDHGNPVRFRNIWMVEKKA